MKYQLGDKVEVSFMGTIEMVEKDIQGNIRYKVSKGIAEGCAVFVKEDCLYPLPGPKDLGVAK